MQNPTSAGRILVKHEELSHPAYPIQLPSFSESVHHPTLVSDGKNVKLGIIVNHQWGKPDLLKEEDKKRKNSPSLALQEIYILGKRELQYFQIWIVWCQVSWKFSYELS